MDSSHKGQTGKLVKRVFRGLLNAALYQIVRSAAIVVGMLLVFGPPLLLLRALRSTDLPLPDASTAAWVALFLGLAVVNALLLFIVWGFLRAKRNRGPH